MTQKIGDTKIMLGGYYSSVANSNTRAGYFTATVNLDNPSIDNLKKYGFSDKLINDFESDRTKRKLEKSIEKGAGKGVPYLEARQIIKKSDGGFYLVGEQYYIVRVESSKGTRSYYHYHDAVISSVDVNGEQEFTLKVPKQQVFIDSEYGSGLGSFEYNNNLYMFYLDNSANKTLAEGGVPVQFREFQDGAFVGVKVTPDGKMTRSFLFDMKDENKTILPDGIDQIDGGVLLSSGRRSQIISGKINTPAMIRLN